MHADPFHLTDEYIVIETSTTQCKALLSVIKLGKLNLSPAIPRDLHTSTCLPQLGPQPSTCIAKLTIDLRGTFPLDVFFNFVAITKTKPIPVTAVVVYREQVHHDSIRLFFDDSSTVYEFDIIGLAAEEKFTRPVILTNLTMNLRIASP